MSATDPDTAFPRVALVGANSPLGKELKDQLAAAGFPGEEVALFDLEEVAGLLTDYDAEARVLLETVAEQVLDHELICFCGDPETARDYLPRLLAADRRGLDCTGAWIGAEDAFAWIPGVSQPPSMANDRAVALPAAAALLLGAAGAALGDLARGAAANIFVPATELGDPGLRELSEQSTAVMNLLEIETDVFGRQMAFDMWPMSRAAPQGAEAVTATLTRLGIGEPATNVIAAPVFHGMALSLFVPGATGDELTEMLRDAGFRMSESMEENTAAGESVSLVDSPLRVVGKSGIHVTNVRDDGRGAWVWATIDNLQARAAAAVAAILTLSGCDVSDALQ